MQLIQCDQIQNFKKKYQLYSSEEIRKIMLIRVFHTL